MIINVKKVNAFTDSFKGGNPAGVVLGSPVLTNKQMKYISKDISVSETAFVFPSKKAGILPVDISFTDKMVDRVMMTQGRTLFRDVFL